MGQLLSMLIGVAAILAATLGLFVGINALVDLAPRNFRAFATLAELTGRLRAGHPDATVVSAGMSGDLEQAVGHGATHVRIGTSLLGMRNTLR